MRPTCTFASYSRHTCARSVVVDQERCIKYSSHKETVTLRPAVITNNYAYILRLLLFPDNAVYSCSLSVKRSHTVILLHTSIIGYIGMLRVYFRYAMGMPPDCRSRLSGNAIADCTTSCTYIIQCSRIQMCVGIYKHMRGHYTLTCFVPSCRLGVSRITRAAVKTVLGNKTHSLVWQAV